MVFYHNAVSHGKRISPVICHRQAKQTLEAMHDVQ